MADASRLRWQLAGDGAGHQELFDEVERHVGRGEFRGMEFLHVNARRIVNSLPAAARLPFRHTINAYRGCSHACSYCFARPTHEYLNLDSGRDFETKIVVKVNAVERLRAELDPRRWCGEPIAMGTNTDPYQRCEGKYRLTRGIVAVLAERANPFSVLTKSTLIVRDVDVLLEAAARTSIGLSFSIGTLDDDVWRTTEPGTPHPRRRIEAIAKLTDAGLSCSVLMGPVIPGLSDDADQIDAVVEAALEAGATSVSPITLHLRPGVREVFLPWLEEAHPDLAERYRTTYRRAYAPKAVQQRIGALVARSIERHGGRRPRRPVTPARGAEAHTAPPPTTGERHSTADPVQLGLSL